jgi:hypothetical protein
VTNALNQSTTSGYDYFLGQVTGRTDLYAGGTPSPLTALVTYGGPGGTADLLDRPSQVVSGSGTTAQTSTTYTYCVPNCNTVTTASDLNSSGDQQIKNVTIYDGLGRVSESQQYECGSGYISQKRTYDGLGRLYQSSNPYRPVTCDSSPAESLNWTTYAYDGLSRVLSVTYPDLSVSGSSYSGSTTTTTDAAGVSRINKSNGAGQLQTVTEVTSAGNLVTSYLYDALDNLVNVSQSGQGRSFSYDSLSRITQAVNPEAGTINYTSYDANGNLLTMTNGHRSPRRIFMML